MKRNTVQTILWDGDRRQCVAMVPSNHITSTPRNAMLKEMSYWIERLQASGQKSDGWRIYQQIIKCERRSDAT